MKKQGVLTFEWKKTATFEILAESTPSHDMNVFWTRDSTVCLAVVAPAPPPPSFQPPPGGHDRWYYINQSTPCNNNKNALKPHIGCIGT